MPSPPPNRQQRKRQRTADHLSATAWALFETHGFEAVTMEQVAAEADVAKGTLYNHFPVKEALLAHRFRVDIAAGMQERAAALLAHKTFEARMRYLLRESAAWHAARKAYLPHYIRFLMNQARYGESRSGSDQFDPGNRQILTLMFQAGQDAGEVDKRLSAADIACSFEYLLFGAMVTWLANPDSDLSTRFLAAFDLAMHGVALSLARPSTDTHDNRAKR
ncbi:TetR/AcrR family transcriptional regulator [Ahniella affigens]|uniref:TetR/AcrR family transcriptional regulator n=1 Tax=Ahniella affigens TaxID=2021234 RepID=A0A2P1PUM3_9GAMM|nr:TetR/AcrR family transcriptional regulator [Ahniella affigens]